MNESPRVAAKKMVKGIADILYTKNGSSAGAIDTAIFTADAIIEALPLQDWQELAYYREVLRILKKRDF